MLNVEDRIKAFDLLHGYGIVDDNQTWILFEDGAAREMSHYGCFVDPPKDDYERAKKIVRFWTIRTARAERAFELKKTQFEALAGKHPNYCGHLPNPPATKEEGDEILRNLRDFVFWCREYLSKAKVEMEKKTPESIKEFRKMKAVEEERLQTAISGVNEIHI